MMALLAAKSQQGAGGAATGTGASDESVGNASAQLQGADPSFALRDLKAIKQTLLNYVSSLGFRVPEASRAVASTQKGIDAAIAALEKAASTQQAMGPPIQMSAIPRPAPPGGVGAPSPVFPSAGGGI
jgi:hypothetical protein